MRRSELDRIDLHQKQESAILASRRQYEQLLRCCLEERIQFALANGNLTERVIFDFLIEVVEDYDGVRILQRADHPWGLYRPSSRWQSLPSIFMRPFTSWIALWKSQYSSVDEWDTYGWQRR